MKKIDDRKEFQNKLNEAVTVLASLVKKTLGPEGQPILLERKGESTLITKDGVTVASHINVKDPVVNCIVESIKEVSMKTNEEAGDGPQDLDSKILTPTGWIKMRDIKAGMKICGSKGTIQEVLGVFPKGKKEKYEVYFSGGGKVTCCEDHLWTVTVNEKVKTIPLKKMLPDYKKQQKDGTSTYKYFVKTNPVKFIEDESKMPIDPYLLGVLLGDGSLGGTKKHRSTIEISLGLAKRHILDKLVLPEGLSLRATWVENKNYYRVKITGRTKDGLSMRKIVESMGLLGKTSKTKFIPKPYLYSSLKSRKALLQGLVDTDAYIDKRGLFEFCTVSKKLADDFADLCRSLGKQITIREKDRSKGNGYSKTNTYNVKERKGYKGGNKIIDIKATGKRTEMQCIKVSNSDSLYITDNYILTHNTTSSVIFAESIIKQAQETLISSVGITPQVLCDNIQFIAEEIVKVLEKSSIQIDDDPEKLKDVAYVSCNGDEEIAKIVVEAIDSAGEDGLITFEEGFGFHTTLEVKDGFSIDKGFSHLGSFGMQLVNNQATQAIDYEDDKNGIPVVMFNGFLEDPFDFSKGLEEALRDKETGQFGNKLVVFAHKFSPMILKGIHETAKTGIHIIPVEIPRLGAQYSQAYLLDDIAIYTGGKTVQAGTKLQEAIPSPDSEYVGFIRRICSYRRNTVIYGGDGSDENVLKRAEGIKLQIKDAESPFDREVHQKRLSRLIGGVAVISVGGKTFLEMKERKDRIEDAVNAAKSAILEGILPGGGVAILKAFYLYEKSLKDRGFAGGSKDFALALEIMRNVCESSIRNVYINTGQKGVDIVVDKILKKHLDDETSLFGYNARTKKYVDSMIDDGVIDPLIVVKSSLLNAVSIATLMLKTGGSVVFDKKDDKKGQEQEPFYIDEEE